MPGFSKAVAVHEAGHAVARVYVGSEATLTELYGEGKGESHGTGEDWRSFRGNAFSSGLKDRLLMTMAGPFAEAKYTRQTRLSMIFGPGLQDWREAEIDADLLVALGLAQDRGTVLELAEKETNKFLRRAWGEIEMAATILHLTGRLEAAQLLEFAKPRTAYENAPSLRSRKLA